MSLSSAWFTGRLFQDNHNYVKKPCLEKPNTNPHQYTINRSVGGKKSVSNKNVDPAERVVTKPSIKH